MYASSPVADAAVYERVAGMAATRYILTAVEPGSLTVCTRVYVQFAYPVRAKRVRRVFGQPYRVINASRLFSRPADAIRYVMGDPREGVTIEESGEVHVQGMRLSSLRRLPYSRFYVQKFETMHGTRAHWTREVDGGIYQWEYDYLHYR